MRLYLPLTLLLVWALPVAPQVEFWPAGEKIFGFLGEQFGQFGAWIKSITARDEAAEKEFQKNQCQDLFDIIEQSPRAKRHMGVMPVELSTTRITVTRCWARHWSCTHSGRDLENLPERWLDCRMKSGLPFKIKIR